MLQSQNPAQPPKVAQKKPSNQEREVEFRGSIWKHPYMLYVVLTCVLFGMLLIMAWAAFVNGWIPNRGIS